MLAIIVALGFVSLIAALGYIVAAVLALVTWRRRSLKTIGSVSWCAA
jgi:hypothetical protein